MLVIEDDRDVRAALQVALQIDDHQVEIACTGAEGIEKARQFKPDVVLCDIGLPGMSGYEVARAFRGDPALRSAFLVALSGYAQAADLVRAGGAGFDHHLAKPTTIPKIQKAIAEASEASRPWIDLSRVRERRVCDRRELTFSPPASNVTCDAAPVEIPDHRHCRCRRLHVWMPCAGLAPRSCASLQFGLAEAGKC